MKTKVKIILSLLFFYSLNCLALPKSDKVSLKLKNTPLRTTLEKLAQQTQVDIVYSDQLVENIIVNCDFQDVSLEEALTQILRDTSVTYKIVRHNQIVLIWRKNQRFKIAGHVIDKATGLPLAYVNVFLANTLLGSATKDNGEFLIPKVPAGTFDLIVSRMGYAVQKQKIVVPGPQTKFSVYQLTPQPFQVPEIEVSAQDMKKWRKNLKKFTELFFSTTSNASECKILNPFVLDFPDTKRGVFAAVARAPLIIKNQALGYRVEYILERYEIREGIIYNAGIPKFEELTPETPEQARKWRRNRVRAYKGSLRHFLATLCKNYNMFRVAGEPNISHDRAHKNPFYRTLYIRPKGKEADFLPVMRHVLDEGFKVFMVKDPWPEIEDINRATTSAKTVGSFAQGKIPEAQPANTNRFLNFGKRPLERILSFPHYLEVQYIHDVEEDNYLDHVAEYRDPGEQKSLITLKVDSLTLDTSGHFYDTFGIRTYGYWTWERMADRLPWDYTAFSSEVDEKLLKQEKARYVYRRCT